MPRVPTWDDVPRDDNGRFTPRDQPCPPCPAPAPTPQKGGWNGEK
jgi:hypothetical protein